MSTTVRNRPRYCLLSLHVRRHKTQVRHEVPSIAVNWFNPSIAHQSREGQAPLGEPFLFLLDGLTP